MKFEITISSISLHFQADGIPAHCGVRLFINGRKGVCWPVVFADADYILRVAVDGIGNITLTPYELFGYSETYWREDLMWALERHLGVRWSNTERKQNAEQLWDLMWDTVCDALAHKQWRKSYELVTDEQFAAAALLDQDWQTDVPGVETGSRVRLKTDGGHAVLYSCDTVYGRHPLTPGRARRMLRTEFKYGLKGQNSTANPDYLDALIRAITNGAFQKVRRERELGFMRRPKSRDFAPGIAF